MFRVTLVYCYSQFYLIYNSTLNGLINVMFFVGREELWVGTE